MCDSKPYNQLLISFVACMLYVNTTELFFLWRQYIRNCVQLNSAGVSSREDLKHIVLISAFSESLFVIFYAHLVVRLCWCRDRNLYSKVVVGGRESNLPLESDRSLLRQLGRQIFLQIHLLITKRLYNTFVPLLFIVSTRQRQFVVRH